MKMGLIQLKLSDFEFKRTIFGGFDRKDVSQYIAMLAAERNEKTAECSNLSARLSALQNENLVLRRDLNSATSALMTSEKTGELIRTEFANETNKTFSDFRTCCDSSLLSLQESSDAIKKEICRLEKLLSSLSDATESVQIRINELCKNNSQLQFDTDVRDEHLFNENEGTD